MTNVAAVGEGESASRRGLAAALRRAAAESLLLLVPVIALDNDSTWRSPWQRRCHARIGAWWLALVIGARRARERADALDSRPEPFPAGMGEQASGVAGAGVAAAGVAAAAGLGGGPGAAVAVDDAVCFEPERLAELARRLRVAERQAARLAGDVGPLGRAAGACQGLDLVRAEAGVMAAAIDRRLAASAAAEASSPGWGGAGSILVRPHAPPARPRAEKASSAVAELVTAIGTNPLELGVRELRAIAEQLARLEAGVASQVISGLRGRPLQVLATAVALAPARLDLGTLNLLPAVVSIADVILRVAPSSMLGEIVQLFPWLDPPPGAGYGPWHRAGSSARSAAAGLVLHDHTGEPVWVRGATPSDVRQGRVGDCYLLAALIGIVRADPGLLRRNLRENPNGTVTVTFPGGAGSTPGPIAVTITRSLPEEAETQREIGAGAENADGDPELWVALYEKAYARLAGSYAGTDGGDPAVAMRQLTGVEADRVDPDQISVEGISARLAAGDVVTLSTRARATGSSGLVPGHAYAILASDPPTGRVLVRSPWDQTASDDRPVWRQWASLRPDVRTVQLGATGRG
ncbi:Calpain family cysteine protease [Parafrankia irregularis]|uniref:Calpain family cysteine protease n=1 Tax=Parafrankia irregularis TaxID=795642 RepID=A0A0S4QPV4_9ACTN|nr:C2 family cysteine protease [Parafrankia irregularis]MBE3204402.1 peptidase C2 calpain [Parafrankia sp. CH37]CUU57671.1 Calpain family cysteine protease [Parafrankia irregularis]